MCLEKLELEKLGKELGEIHKKSTILWSLFGDTANQIDELVVEQRCAWDKGKKQTDQSLVYIDGKILPSEGYRISERERASVQQHTARLHAIMFTVARELWRCKDLLTNY